MHGRERKVFTFAGILAAFCVGFWIAPAMKTAESKTDGPFRSGVVRWNELEPGTGDWGEMRSHFRGESFGTTDTLAALAVIKPGMALHPAHRHAEEEFLVITKGSGTWHLDGKEFPAMEGDVLYTEPWVVHGLVNTGEEPLTFFVAKWNSKGVELPPEPAGDHGR